MGGETLAHWLSHELGADQQKINDLLVIIDKLQNRQHMECCLKGAEYDLYLNGDEIEVLSHELSLSRGINERLWSGRFKAAIAKLAGLYRNFSKSQ